jgi:hypothetical protein
MEGYENRDHVDGICDKCQGEIQFPVGADPSWVLRGNLARTTRKRQVAGPSSAV